MRILFLLTQDLNSPSGIGRYQPIMSELAKRGHEIFLVGLHSNYDALEQKRYKENGVDIHYVSQMHVKKHGNQKSYYSTLELIKVSIVATIKLFQEAITIPADIVHVCKPHPMNSFSGYLVRKMRGSKLFLDYDDYEVGTNRFSGDWQRKIIAFFENQTPQRVEHITTHSSFLYNHLSSLGIPSKKISIIPNGVDLHRFQKPSNNVIQQLKQRYNLTNKRVVIYVGSLSLSNHPIDLLLKAFKQLINSYPDTVLLIIGGGEDFNNLVHLSEKLGIQDRVIFAGKVPTNEVVNYYYLGNVSVDPVNDDVAAKGRCPLKLFESCACGIPFVTADIGDRRQILGNPPAGLLAEPGNENSLASEIGKVLSDPLLANSLRLRGHELAEKYSWDKLAKTLEAVYLNHLAHH